MEERKRERRAAADVRRAADVQQRSSEARRGTTVVWRLALRQHTTVEAAVLEMDPTKSAQAALDFKLRLGLRIAAGPEAFHALADTKQDDILSPQVGWRRAKAPGAMSTRLFVARSLTRWTWTRAAREDFIAMCNTIRLFVTDAKCQEMLIRSAV